MQYRADPKTKSELSALGFGCMRFPGKSLTEELICSAVKGGVNYFDTAWLYPGSEETLGAVLQKHGLRDSIYLSTKLPHGRCRALDDVDRFFKTSLERLKTEHIDYYFIHMLGSFAQWQRLVEFGIEDWIATQKISGRIGQIGFSFHGSNDEFTKILESYDWDMTLVQFNYMNEHYQAGIDGIKMAHERGMAVMIMEPLLGGSLATNVPAEAQAYMHEVAPDRSCAAWSFRWLLDHPEVTVVLSGMNNMAALEDNLMTFSDAEPGCMTLDEHAVIELVRGEFARQDRIPCTGCNYCTPCTKGINIPACFANYNESFSIGWGLALRHHMIGAGISHQSVHLASDCISCGACVKKCPQHIDIPAELARVSKRLEPGPTKHIVRLVGKVMSRN